MRIWIQENSKVRFAFWLPSWLWIINEALKHLKVEGQKFLPVQRKKIITAMKLTKKYHRDLIDIDILSHDGTRVIVKM